MAGYNIITFLSRYTKNNNTDINDYECNFTKNSPIKGHQTNDAPVKALLNYAKDNNDYVKCIYYIATKEVEAANPVDNENTLMDGHTVLDKIKWSGE